MTFMVYKPDTTNGKTTLSPTGETYHPHSLLYKAWEHYRKPINNGWEISADELIRIHSNGAESYQTRRLLSDFHPKATWRIGITEILHVYAYTWGDKKGNPQWTPFMVKGRDVFYRDDYEKLTEKQKNAVLSCLPEFSSERAEFVEFLYLNVNKNGTWVWGRTGMTNAAFLQSEARDYFRNHF